MTELKTLEDFEFHKSAKSIGVCQECGYLQEGNDLRHEAIKWVKELDKEMAQIRINPEAYAMFQDFRMKHDGEMPSELLRAQHQILWIKHFFNITPEDLK